MVLEKCKDSLLPLTCFLKDGDESVLGAGLVSASSGLGSQQPCLSEVSGLGRNLGCSWMTLPSEGCGGGRKGTACVQGSHGA